MRHQASVAQNECHKVIHAQRICWSCSRQTCRQVRMCQEMKWRLVVGGVIFGFRLLTDNCWFVAMSAAELQTMTNAWNSLLRQAGGSMKVFDKNITRRQREEEFKALGVWGSLLMVTSQKVIAERELTAGRKLSAFHHKLCNKDVELKCRLRLLTSGVLSSMY